MADLLAKASLLALISTLGIFCLSRLPAIHSFHWFLRVGLPEIGFWALLPTLLFASLSLSRFPRATGLASLLILAFVVWPWYQAFDLSAKLKKDWPFSSSLPRHPLKLAAQTELEMVTESYGGKLQWDRYRVPGGAAQTRLLFIHGGSWRNGTRKDYPELFRYLASRGCEVVSVTYTLSGTAPYPAAPSDIQEALEQLVREDELPLFLAGRSSGGHLALLAAYNNPDKVSGVIAFYPPVDMRWSYEHPSNPRVLDSKEAIEQFMAAKPSDDPVRYQEASPLHILEKGSPPTLLIHGRSDCLVYHRQSEMLSERLDVLKVPHYLLSIPWMEHGGDIFLNGPSGRLSAWGIESFLAGRVR